MMITPSKIEFLNHYRIKYIEKDNIIVMLSNINLSHLTLLPENLDLFNNCIIDGFLWLDSLESVPKNFLNNSIIKGNLWLTSLKNLPKNFLNNTIIYGSIHLYDVENLPKGFNIKVRDSIVLHKLKSEMLKKLLFEPGINRQLGFNLLK